MRKFNSVSTAFVLGLMTSGLVQSSEVARKEQDTTHGRTALEPSSTEISTLLALAGGNLGRVQLSSLEALYSALGGNNIQSEDHRSKLKTALVMANLKRDHHEYKFSSDFLELLGRMDAAEACQFFDELFLIAPVAKTGEKSKYFKLLTEFFVQLPREKQNLENLHVFLAIQGVSLSGNGTYIIPGDDVKTKNKLRKIQEALKRGNISSMDQVRIIYNEPASLDNSIRSLVEGVGNNLRELPEKVCLEVSLTHDMLVHPEKGICK